MNTAEYFIHHHGALDPGEFIEIRAFEVQTRAVRRGWFRDAEEAARFALALSPEYDVYHSVNVRQEGRGDKAGTPKIICLHADIDYKVWDGDRDACRQALEGFDLEPSTLVDSGGGLHAYWRLAEPLPATPEHVARAEGLMARLYYRLAPGDDTLDGVQDISRILRTPGTTNKKPAYGGAYPTRVVHASPAAYSLDQFDRILPFLPERVAPGLTGSGKAGDWSLADVERMLSFIDPVDPYGDGDGYRGWLAVLMGVHSAFPGQEGYELAERWSEPRIAAGCHGNFATQRGKWWGLRRGEGQQRATLGTVVHLARQGGWEPPKGPTLVLVPPRAAKDPAPDWRAALDEYPPLARQELPQGLRDLVEHLEPLTVNWQADWAELLALTGFSLLVPGIRFEKAPLNLWFLGIAPQGTGKSRSTEEVYLLVRHASVKGDLGVKILTSYTPEGLLGALDGVGVPLLSYHSEYSGYLETMRREYMGGMKARLCDIHDGLGAFYQKASLKVEAESPYMTIIATTVARSFRDHTQPADLANGYISRFLICAPDTETNQLGHINEIAHALMVDRLLDRALALRQFTTARYDTPGGQAPPAIDALRDRLGLNQRRVITLEEDMQAERLSTQRIELRAKKLATLLELLEAAPRRADATTLLVREENVARGIRLAMRAYGYGLRLTQAVTGSVEEADSQKIVGALEKQRNNAGLSRSEINQKTHLGANRMNVALGLLEEHGLIVKVKAGKKTLYRLAEEA